jgi:hypothetical protein
MSILRSALLDSNLEVALSSAKTIARFLGGYESEEKTMIWRAAGCVSCDFERCEDDYSSGKDQRDFGKLAELTDSYPLL